MKFPKPISEQRRQELERQLKVEKEKFKNAARESAEKIEQIFAIQDWIREYPLQTAALLFVTGLTIIRSLGQPVNSIDS